MGCGDKHCGRFDKRALLKIPKGLYLLTSGNGEECRGMIIDSVLHTGDERGGVIVCVKKDVPIHDIMRSSGKMNLHFLNTDTPEELLKELGYGKGLDFQNFGNMNALLMENDAMLISEDYIGGFLALFLENYMENASCGFFECSISASAIFYDKDTLTPRVTERRE